MKPSLLPSPPIPVVALIAAALLASVLTACGKSTSGDSSASTATDTVETLMANRKRLDELRLECRINHAKVGDALCGRVAEATRRIFLGEGMPYNAARAPKTLWPAASASSAASSGGSASSGNSR